MGRNKKRESIEKQDSNFWIQSLIGGALGLGLIILLVLIMPLVVLGFEEPNDLALFCVCVCSLLGSAFGAFITFRQDKEQPIQKALAVFLVIIIPLTTVSLFVSGSTSVFSVLAIIASIAVGITLVTFVSLKSSKNRKRRMKQVMKRR